MQYIGLCSVRKIKVFASVRTGSRTCHLAVPEKVFGLTLILRFFDRCGNCALPSSATGSGNAQFPPGPSILIRISASPEGSSPVSHGAGLGGDWVSPPNKLSEADKSPSPPNKKPAEWRAFCLEKVSRFDRISDRGCISHNRGVHF